MRRGLCSTAILCLVVLVTLALGCGEEAETPTLSPTPTQYDTFSKYGFSFEYPKEMSLSEQPSMGTIVDENSGIVLGEKENKELELVTVGWQGIAEPVDIESSLIGSVAGGLAALEAGEGVEEVVRGEQLEATKSGHQLLYQSFTVRGGGEVMRGVVSAWYCDESNRLFNLITLYSGEDALALFQTYLDSFVCHQ